VQLPEGNTKIGWERLENWQRWNRAGSAGMIAKLSYPALIPACSQYRSSEVFAETPEYSPPVDTRDAYEVECILRELPGHLRNATKFYFFGRPRIVGVSRDVIEGWVLHAAREIAER
jgi:hypothetical protein